MADEQNPAGGQRPVEAPIIDMEAEEVGGSEAEALNEVADEEIGSRRNYQKHVWAAALVVGLAILVGGAIWLLRLNESRVPAMDETLGPRLQAVELGSEQIQLRLAELTTAIQDLRKAQAEATKVEVQQPVPSEQLQQIESRIANLNQSIERIFTSLKDIEKGLSAQQNEIRSVTGVIGELQSRLSVDGQQGSLAPSQTNELASALLQLRLAVEEGRSFEQELQRVKAMMPQAKEIEELASASATGIPKTSDLSNQLERLVEDLRKPTNREAPSTEASGIWEILRSKVTSMISVRKLTDARWLDAAEGLLERVKQGDLEGGVREIKLIGEPAPDALAAWLQAAEGRIGAEQAMDRLSARALQRLGGGA
jgi:hypothetical protein